MVDKKSHGQKKMSKCVVRTAANVRALTGVDCDEAWVVVADGGEPTLYTDFRYIPMAHRVAPKLKVRDIKHFGPDLSRSLRKSRLLLKEFWAKNHAGYNAAWKYHCTYGKGSETEPAYERHPAFISQD